MSKSNIPEEALKAAVNGLNATRGLGSLAHARAALEAAAPHMQCTNVADVEYGQELRCGRKVDHDGTCKP